MTTSDKVVLIVGIANCLTMAGTGWMGLKAFEAIASKKDSKQTPEEKAQRTTSRRKRFIAISVLLVEGASIFFFTWKVSRNNPLTFWYVVDICFGFLAVQFGILAFFVWAFVDFFREQLNIMKAMANEIDKKAYSRKKISASSRQAN